MAKVSKRYKALQALVEKADGRLGPPAHRGAALRELFDYCARFLAD